MPLDLLLRREVNISLLLQSFAFHKLCGHKLWRDRSCPSRETVYKDRHANLVSIAAEFRSMSRQGVLLIQFKVITGFPFSLLPFPEFHHISLGIQQDYIYPRGKKYTVRINCFAYKHGAMTGSGPDAKPFNHKSITLTTGNLNLSWEYEHIYRRIYVTEHRSPTTRSQPLTSHERSIALYFASLSTPLNICRFKDQDMVTKSPDYSLVHTAIYCQFNVYWIHVNFQLLLMENTITGAKRFIIPPYLFIFLGRFFGSIRCFYFNYNETKHNQR